MLTKDQWKLIEKEIPTFLKKQGPKKGCVTFLAFMFQDGSVHYHANTACHAGMRSFSHTGKGKPLLTIMSGVQDNNRGYEFTREEMISYADWLCFHSPYKECFLNKSAEEVIDGCWLLNPEAPSNLLAGAAFATRHPTEWPQLFRSWLMMVSYGIHPDKAFLHSFYMQAEQKGFPITINNSLGWHQPLKGSRSKQYFENFINHTPEDVGEPYNKCMTYGRVDAVWGEGGDFDFYKATTIKPAKGKMKEVNYNIFYKPKMIQGKTYLFETKEQVLSLIEEMERMIYEAA